MNYSTYTKKTRLDITPPEIVIFDLDRTITMSGTFTPFLLSSRSTRIKKAYLLFQLIQQMLAYKLGFKTRQQLKNKMFQLSFNNQTSQPIDHLAQIFTKNVLNTNVRQSAIDVIKKHSDRGDVLILATASVDLYAYPIAKKLGFSHTICTQTTVNNGSNGVPVIKGENCYAEHKLKMLINYLEQHITNSQTMRTTAYSDDLSDLPILSWAHNGIFINPKPRTKRMAKRLGLSVQHWS